MLVKYGNLNCYITEISNSLVRRYIKRKTKTKITSKAELIIELWATLSALSNANDYSILEGDEIVTRQNQLLEEYVLLTNYEPSENHELVGFISDMPIERELELE